MHVTESRNVLPAGLFDEGDAAAAVPNVALDEVDSKAHQAVALATARQVAPRWDAMISAAMNQQLTSSPHRCLSKVLPYAQMHLDTDDTHVPGRCGPRLATVAHRVTI